MKTLFALLLASCGGGHGTGDVGGDADADADSDSDTGVADDACARWCAHEIECGATLTEETCERGCDCFFGEAVRSDVASGLLECSIAAECAVRGDCTSEAIAGLEPSDAGLEYLEVCEGRKPACEGIAGWDCGDPTAWSDAYIAVLRVCFADTPCEEIVDCIRTAGDRICPSA